MKKKSKLAAAPKAMPNTRGGVIAKIAAKPATMPMRPMKKTGRGR